MITSPLYVTIVEVGPRDGLQNEKNIIPTDKKVAFIDALSASGLKVIEVGSMVSPKWVPQMGDSAEVFQKIQKRPGVRYPVLVPNEKGLERAFEIGVKDIAVFTAASDAFNKKNVNMTVEESLKSLEAVVARAKASGLWVRGYVSTVFYCPYSGRVESTDVVKVSLRLYDMGVDEISLGDTIGAAAPDDVDVVLKAVLPKIPIDKIAMHFHDTKGTALANIERSFQYGIRIFDSSAGGLGGCPYAPGASGNVSTESVLELFKTMGIDTGVNMEAVRDAYAKLSG